MRATGLYVHGPQLLVSWLLWSTSLGLSFLCCKAHTWADCDDNLTGLRNLWMCLCGCFQKGSAEKEQPALNVGSTMLWAVVLD